MTGPNATDVLATCSDVGCPIQEGEFCPVHGVERWDCNCPPYGTDTYCPVHGLLNQDGEPEGWLDPHYEGYPPDSDLDAMHFEHPDGGFTVVARGWSASHVAGSTIRSGSYVKIDEFGALEESDLTSAVGIAIDSSPAGHEVQIMITGTVQTAMPTATDREDHDASDSVSQ